MRLPSFTNQQFIDQTVLNSAFSTGLQSTSDALSYSVTSYGLLNAQNLAFSSSNLNLTLTASTGFAAVFSSGVLATLLGNTNGSTTNTVTLNLSSFVPSTGSQTVYIAATVFPLQINPTIVYGPPIGDPNYSTTFSPTQVYTVQAYSLNIFATLTAPDNTDTIELGRVSLTAGATTIPAIVTSYQPIVSFAITYTGVVNALGYIPVSNAIFSDANTWTGVNTYTQAVAAEGFTISGNSVVTSFNGRYGEVLPAADDYTLSQIGTVSLTFPSSGQVLQYNGTNWVNASITQGVSSVFGRTGAVTAESGDYSAFYGQLAEANTWTGDNVFDGATFNNSLAAAYNLTLGIGASTSTSINIPANTGANYTSSINWTRNNNLGYAFQAYNVSTSTSLFYVTDSGNVVAQGTIQSGSSEAIKYDISPLNYEKSMKVLDLVPVSFTYKASNKKSLGFVSERVREVYPELVEKNVDFLPLNYDGLIAPLLAVVKHLKDKIDRLEAKLGGVA